MRQQILEWSFLYWMMDGLEREMTVLLPLVTGIRMRKKLKGTLKELAEKINAKGLKFGLWIEPEMTNKDSDLYRAHRTGLG